MASTAVDRFYGRGQSGNHWKFQRNAFSFETIPEAAKRKKSTDTKVDLGIKKPKDHTGKFSSYTIQIAELLKGAYITAEHILRRKVVIYQQTVAK